MSEHLIDFLDLLNAAMDSSRILDAASEFLVKRAQLANCLVFVAGKEMAYFAPSRELLVVAREIARHAQNNNAFVLVRNPAQDPLTNALEESGAIQACLLAFPLQEGEKCSGAMVLVAERNLSPDVALLSSLVKRTSIALSRAYRFQEVKQSSVTDALTGLYNKAHFLGALDKEVLRARRNARPISLVFFDFDDFKKYNDTRGHVAGDELLGSLGKIVRQNVRAIDIPCRFGGEEFAVILPETSHESAFATAERLRAKVEAECPATISVGAITCLNASVSPETLLKEADNALYKAKRLGKNRTVSFVIVDKALGVIDVNEAAGLGKQ